MPAHARRSVTDIYIYIYIYTNIHTRAREDLKTYLYMCTVLLCLICLFDLTCFFLPSHLSFKNVYIYIHATYYTPYLLGDGKLDFCLTDATSDE